MFGVLSFCLAYLVFVWCTWCLVYVVFCLATLCILRHNWCLCHWDVVFLTFRIWDGLSNISITKNVQIFILWINLSKAVPFAFSVGKGTPAWKKYTTPGCEGCDNYEVWFLTKLAILWQFLTIFDNSWQLRQLRQFLTILKRQSWRLVTFETLITVLTIENLNAWQSLVPDN